MDIKLGIITINFNTEDLLNRLIKSILTQTYKNWVMIIVNNSESDSAIKQVISGYDREKIRLLSINKNIGYSKGNNAGFNYLFDEGLINKNDMILFTNEDIVIDNDCFFEEAIKRIEAAGCGFWGPKIINTDGSLMLPHPRKSNYLKCLLHIGNNGTIDRIFRINRNIKDYDRQLEVFLLNGAFFICNVRDFLNAGMLDENTFIYYEEELLYRNVAARNIKVLYDPTLHIYHEHSASVKKSFSILHKKKFVFEGELYFLRTILKINKFLEYLFRFERNVEFLLYKLSALLKSK